MFVVKVAYDEMNQRFQLVDSNLANMFQHGEVYFLMADFSREGEIDSGVQYVDLSQADVGHA